MGSEEPGWGEGYRGRGSESSWVLPSSSLPKSRVFASKVPLKSAYCSPPLQPLPWSSTPYHSPSIVQSPPHWCSWGHYCPLCIILCKAARGTFMKVKLDHLTCSIVNSPMAP